MDASVLLLRLKRKEENNGGCWPQCLTVTLPSGPLTARVHTVEVFAAVHQLRGRQWQCRCCCCCASRTITMCTFTFAFPVDAAAARKGCCSSSALCKGNRLEARIVGDGDDGLLIVSSSSSVCPSDLPLLGQLSINGWESGQDNGFYFAWSRSSACVWGWWRGTSASIFFSVMVKKVKNNNNCCCCP